MAIIIDLAIKTLKKSLIWYVLLSNSDGSSTKSKKSSLRGVQIILRRLP